jgi:hypothetical protein
LMMMMVVVVVKKKKKKKKMWTLLAFGRQHKSFSYRESSLL